MGIFLALVCCAVSPDASEGASLSAQGVIWLRPREDDGSWTVDVLLLNAGKSELEVPKEPRWVTAMMGDVPVCRWGNSSAEYPKWFTDLERGESHVWRFLIPDKAVSANRDIELVLEFDAYVDGKKVPCTVRCPLQKPPAPANEKSK